MSTPQTAADSGLPPIPDTAVQEGARWRFHRPSAQAVATWFDAVPLDEGMENKDYVGGVVLIPQNDKAKYTLADGSGTRERNEQVYVPYVQIGTRIFYARRLAEARKLRYVARPLDVPRDGNPTSVYYNGNMPSGLWWHVVVDSNGQNVRFLCCTWTVALLDDNDRPVIEGQGTKQVTGMNYGGPDENALMKAETGAIGRALGVAGILTVGTGVASAEDMQDYSGREGAAAVAPVLPPTELPTGAVPQVSEAEQLSQLRSRYLALQNVVQEQGRWVEYQPWFTERKAAEGWGRLDDVPREGLEAMVAKLDAISKQPFDPDSGSEA